MFLIGLPIAYYAAKYGVDIDLLTRGAGFGYLGSTLTSLIYASFTFLLFAIEASILSVALQHAVRHAAGAGARAQLAGRDPHRGLRHQPHQPHAAATQPIWLALQFLPLIYIALEQPARSGRLDALRRRAGRQRRLVNLLLFGMAASMLLSLLPQIGEQVDYLRFLPQRRPRQSRCSWWTALLIDRPGLGAASAASSCWPDRSWRCWRCATACRGRGQRSRRRCTSRLSRGARLADRGAGADGRVRHRLPAEDQRHQRLCRLDRLVEFLLAPDAQPSRAAWSGWCSMWCWRCC